MFSRTEPGKLQNGWAAGCSSPRRPHKRQTAAALGIRISQNPPCSAWGLAGGGHSPCRGSFPFGKTIISESVAFRLAPESFYSVWSRCGVQVSLGLRAGDHASASANRYRVSSPLRVNRTPTSLVLAPAGGPVGLVSSDPPICSALPSVQNQPVAVSARPTPEPNTAGPRTAKQRPCVSVGSDSGAGPRLKHRKLAFGVTACPLGPERRTLS